MTIRRFSDGQGSDLIVRCGGNTWQLHKFVMCNQSEWFAKACKRNFNVSKDMLVFRQ